jgi:hypothetical protein
MIEQKATKMELDRKLSIKSVLSEKVHPSENIEEQKIPLKIIFEAPEEKNGYKYEQSQTPKIQEELKGEALAYRER